MAKVTKTEIVTVKIELTKAEFDNLYQVVMDSSTVLDHGILTELNAAHRS